MSARADECPSCDATDIGVIGLIDGHAVVVADKDAEEYGRKEKGRAKDLAPPGSGPEIAKRPPYFWARFVVKALSCQRLAFQFAFRQIPLSGSQF